MKTLYGIMVYKCNIEPNYFLDEMTQIEVDSLLDIYYDNYKEKWEMLRLQYHAILSSDSRRTEAIKMEDVLPFSWDKKKSEEPAPKLTDKDIERIRDKFKIDSDGKRL